MKTFDEIVTVNDMAGIQQWLSQVRDVHKISIIYFSRRCQTPSL